MAIVFCLAACGTSRIESNVAVQVGDATITKAAVEHRMSVMMLVQSLPGRTKPANETLRQQAVAYLINAQWLIQETGVEWYKASKQEVHRRVEEKQTSSFPGGEAEFRAFLRRTGRTAEDVTQEVEVELATAKIRRWIAGSAPAVTEAEATEYYRRHKERFGLTETLARVRASIRHMLVEEAQRTTLERFVREWRGRWKNLTDCEEGYVVEKCMQYGGPNVAEDPLGLD